MQLFSRPDYERQLLAFRNKQIIKVITGVRRCGKSSLLRLLRETLLADGVEDERIVSINFEDFDADPLRDPKALHDYLKSKLVKGKVTYILLDEVQLVHDFTRVIDSLFIRENVDLYMGQMPIFFRPRSPRCSRDATLKSKCCRCLSGSLF